LNKLQKEYPSLECDTSESELEQKNVHVIPASYPWPQIQPTPNLKSPPTGSLRYIEHTHMKKHQEYHTNTDTTLIFKYYKNL